MADIFVSYARPDRERVRVMASQLEEHGWTIWWDRQIFAGTDFDVVIQRELDTARAVVVVWSKDSIASRWVKAEAGEGLRRELLIPVLIDGSYPPLAFRNIQTVSFGDSALDRGSPAFQELLDSLTNLLGAAPRQPSPVSATPSTPRHEPAVAASPVQPAAVAAAVRPPPTRYLVPLVAITLVILLGIASWLVFYRATGPAAIAGTDSSTPGAPAAVLPPEDPAPAPQPVAGPADTGPPADSGADAIPQAAVESFVRDFVSAANTSDVDLMLPFYADRVDYFGEGMVGQEFIRKDKQTYYRRWPQVTLALDGDVAVRDRETSGTRLVRFVSSYEVESPARKARATGTVETTLVVALIDGALKVVDLKETAKSTPR